MKRYLLTASCVLLCSILATATNAAQVVSLQDAVTQVRVVDQQQDGVRLEIGIGEVQFHEVTTQAGDFTLLSFPGCARSQAIGEPDLPLVNRLLSVPFGAELNVEVLDYRIEEIRLSDLGIANILIPVQPSVSKSDDPSSVPFEFDQSAYNEDGFYTLPVAQGEILGTMRALHLGHVSIAPIEYNAKENVIRVYKSLTVQVTYRGADWGLTSEMRRRYSSPYFQGVYDQVDNYAQQVGASRDDLVTYPVKYLIISDRMFETQLQPFIAWKTKKGFMVETAFTDVIGGTTNEIKSYIQDAYNNGTPEDPAPSFVLFVGDDQQIPAYDYGAHISDLYFCEFTGDNFPEIYYGRFSAQNTTQLQPQIDKTLEYEQYMMPDPSYLDEVTLVSGVDGTYAITHGNGQINYGTNYYFNAAHGISPHVWLYPESNGAVEGAIIQTIDDGIGLYNYTAHCSHAGHADPSFTTDDLPDLANWHMYLLGIGNCCLANTFGDDYSTPCFGEMFLQLEDRGGIGYIGGSNSTYWNEDYWWGVGNGPVVGDGPTYEQTGLGAYDGAFHDHGEPVTQHYITNGAIIFAGNMAVTESGSSRIAYYWQIYHLMGDPSVMTYLGVPAVNNVTHPATLLLTANTVPVQADPGSYVGISKNGELYGCGYVDGSGSIDVDITPFGVPGEVDIVVTGQNRQPYISTMMVIAPDGPYCVYDGRTLTESFGNGNGVVDAGESFLMGIQLKNVGPDTAYNVDATLSTADTLVTISDNYEYYGTIAGSDGLSFVADGYAFALAEATPDGHNISFHLTVTGTNRDTWEGDFTVRVHAPSVAYMSVAIDDASGNSNGILDPGETADFVVTVQNFGSGEAFNVSGTLSESDQYVSLPDDYGLFGHLDSLSGVGSNAADVFTVSADAASPMGYSVPLTLTLAGDNGYSAQLPFSVIVGDRVVFYTDDFSYDQGWSGLGGTAEWTIGAATGGTGSDSYGNPDPSVDHSPTEDNGVLGNDLTPGTGGDYNGGIGSVQWATSPLLDCTDFTGVQLRFYRWLGIESPSYDQASLEVFDGTSWVSLFANDGGIDESSWSEQFYDVSAYADGNPDFQVRFGLGPTDGSWNYCGWNIDDFELKGYDQSGEGDALLSFASQEFTDSLAAGESVERTVRVYNTGDGTLRIRFAPLVSWLSCSNEQNYVAPGDSLDFPFVITTTALTPGDHVGQLHYTSNDYGNQSGDVTVNVHIHTPGVSFAQAGLSDSLATGDTSAVSLRVYNTGLGNLHITFGSDSPWLGCSGDEYLVAPGDSAEVPVTLDCGGLAPGDYGGNLTYVSDDPANASGSVPVALHIYAPVCEIGQTEVSYAGAPGDSVALPLTINNPGPGRLAYSIGCQAFDTPKDRSLPAAVAAVAEPLGYRGTGDDKGDGDQPFYAPVAKSHGGPDLYGYSWIDSDDPGGPVYSWVDISSVGTAVSLGDDQALGPFAIGFGFPYYDSTYTELYIGSNGIVTFGAGSSAHTNQAIPGDAVPNALLSLWWDDLAPDDGGTVYYYHDAASGRFIVSFENVPNYQYPSGTGSLSFQAILYPNGKITMQYATMDAGADAEGLSGATVGIESPAGDDGLQVAYNAAYMHDQLAIDFTVVRWLWVEPSGGLIDPYGSAVVEVHVNAADLEDGQYSGQLSITTNDPLLPSLTLPVAVSLSSWICGDVDGNQSGPNVTDLTYLVEYLFKGGPAPAVPAAGDADGIGGDNLNVNDLTYLVNFLFKGGPDPICH